MKPKSSAKKVVAADGLDIYYWVTWRQELSKNFLVLHPGSSMNHSSLESLEQGLQEQGYPTIVFDPRGFGHSKAPAKPEYFTLERYSSDLQKIIEQEGLEKPSLVSHSFGFMPVVDYVARTKNAADITGICASHCFVETAPNKLLFHLFNRVLRYTEYLGSAGMKLAHLLREKPGGYPDRYPNQSNSKSDFEVWLSIVDVPFPEIKAHIVSGLEVNKWNIRQQLGYVNVPLVLIYGSRDVMVVPRAGIEIAGVARGDCTIKVIEGSHSLPILEFRKVLEVMQKYRT